jgi:hypothetical protein
MHQIRKIYPPKRKSNPYDYIIELQLVYQNQNDFPERKIEPKETSTKLQKDLKEARKLIKNAIASLNSVLK